jgi:formamidopyrimidine-DNA glycosylase
MNMAQWYKIFCQSCGYTNELILGSSVTAESLKDLNEDSADFKIFECKNDHELFSIDVHSSDFNNKCPVCGSVIKEIDIKDIDKHVCPKCGSKTLNIEPLVHM